MSVPWFLVQLRKNSAPQETSDMLLPGVDELLRFVEMQSSEDCVLTSVSLISPAHVNGGTGWKLEPLAALWEAEEPDAEGQMADVYELASGAYYARSALGTPLDSLRKVQVVADFR